MAGKGPRILITHALEDLAQEDFSRFVAQMREPRTDNFSPKRFRNAQVVNKSQQQLADLLVDAFSDNAVSVTLTLLRAIDANSVADFLEEEYSENQPGPRKQNPGKASGATVHQKHFVDRHRIDLIERVSNINPILDYLLQEDVLTQEQYNKVMGIRPKHDQMRFLFSEPLAAGGERSKDVVMTALEKQERYLIMELKEKD